jgi:hypothetical protein
MYLGTGIVNEEISGANSMGVELNHKAMNRAGDSEKTVGVLLCEISTGFYLSFENTSDAFVPPNPKLFERDTLTSLSWDIRAT